MTPAKHVYDPDYFDGEVCTVCGEDIRANQSPLNAHHKGDPE